VLKYVEGCLVAVTANFHESLMFLKAVSALRDESKTFAKQCVLAEGRGLGHPDVFPRHLGVEFVGGSYPYVGLGPVHLPGRLLSLRSNDEIFMLGFVGKESDTPNEGNGKCPACRPVSEANCVVSFFRSSVRQEIVINWVRAELSALARVSYRVGGPARICRPATSLSRPCPNRTCRCRTAW